MAVALATEHGLQQWIVTGTFLRGWAMMALGRRDGGLARMTEAYAAYRALGLALNQPWWIDMLAEAYAAAGQPDAGLSLLDALASACRPTNTSPPGRRCTARWTW